METGHYSETSENLYYTTQRQIQLSKCATGPYLVFGITAIKQLEIGAVTYLQKGRTLYNKMNCSIQIRTGSVLNCQHSIQIFR
jgi:hypothetical protein